MKEKIKPFLSVTAVCLRAVPSLGRCCTEAGQRVLSVLLLLTQKKGFVSSCDSTRPVTTALKGTECYCSVRILGAGQSKTEKTRHSNGWKLRDNQRVDRNTQMFL